jgi:hypothetical protein
MIKVVKIIEKKLWSSLVIIPSVVLEENFLEKVYDDDDADGRQMIAIAHWDLRPRRAKRSRWHLLANILKTIIDREKLLLAEMFS